MALNVDLVWPAPEHLPSYRSALERGWSPDNIRGIEATNEQLAAIAEDPQSFLASLVLKSPDGALLTLPDGSKVPRLPGYRRWLWDGEFCGSIGLRWQAGTSELPPHVLGHVGYAVVPWKQNRGYATEALRQILGDARAEGLGYVEITTDPPQHGISAGRGSERRRARRRIREAAVLRRNACGSLPDLAVE